MTWFLITVILFFSFVLYIYFFLLHFYEFLGRPQGMTLCLHDRVSVCVSVSPSTFWYTLFIGLYLFNTATDQVHFCHACTLGPGLYSPNVFGDAALINYANLCKFSQNHITCSYFLISRTDFFKFGIQIYYR